MANDKNVEVGHEAEGKEEEFGQDTSTRARNRTVMLTPEITGQVRKMLAQEMGSNEPASSGQGGLRAAPAASTYSPAGSGSTHSGGFGGASSPGNQMFRESVHHSPPPVHSHAVPQAAAPQSVQRATAKNTPVIGFLVSFDNDANGEVSELRTGRWIISSEQTTSGNFIIVNDSSVSPLHAILRVSAAGEIQVLDQLSEHGTGVKKFGSDAEEELTGSMSSLDHGDLVRFGKRNFHVCVIQKG